MFVIQLNIAVVIAVTFSIIPNNRELSDGNVSSPTERLSVQKSTTETQANGKSSFTNHKRRRVHSAETTPTQNKIKKVLSGSSNDTDVFYETAHVKPPTQATKSDSAKVTSNPSLFNKKRRRTHSIETAPNRNKIKKVLSSSSSSIEVVNEPSDESLPIQTAKEKVYKDIPFNNKNWREVSAKVKTTTPPNSSSTSSSIEVVNESSCIETILMDEDGIKMFSLEKILITDSKDEANSTLPKDV